MKINFTLVNFKFCKMTEYSCSACKYTSMKKQNTIRHLNNKLCKELNSVLIEIPNHIECANCNKKFASKKGYDKHVKKTCKEKFDTESEIGRLKKENNELIEFINNIYNELKIKKELLSFKL